MTYTGALVAKYSSADETYNFAPDPMHAVAQSHLTGTPDPYAATHQVPSGTGQAYAGSDFPNDVAQGNGMYFYRPTRSHQGNAGRRTGSFMRGPNAEIINGPAQNELHQEDGQNRYEQKYYAPRPYQAASQHYTQEHREGNLWPDNPNRTGAVAILRGINSYSQNNPSTLQYPEGVRRGLDPRPTRMEDTRRLGRRKYRYGIQVSLGKQTYMPNNIPPTTPAPGSVGWSLPSWKPAGFLKKQPTPAMAQIPTDFSTDVLAQPQQQVGYGVVF